MLARVALVAAAPLFAAALFGPPHIKVTAVSPQPAAVGAPAFTVDIEHHHEDVAVTGRAEGMRGGKQVSQVLTLTRKDSTHYNVARQWDAGSPWVLVFSVEQGPDGKHGVAEAVVSIDATGAVKGIEYTTPGFLDRTGIPRRVTKEKVKEALVALGAKP